MKNCSIAWAVAGLLLLACGGLIYKFIFQGATTGASDGRIAIVLEPAERDLVLTEMRAFLSSVQQITLGVVNKDLAAITTAARLSGKAAAQAVPGSLMGKLPIEFKTLGLSTHDAFDVLALNTEQMNEVEPTLEQLSVLLNNCVACHAAYRIDVAPAAP